MCMLLQYGRNSLAEITREVDGKTEEEVSTYSKTFWKRYKELSDWERVIKNIGACCSSLCLCLCSQSCFTYTLFASL